MISPAERAKLETEIAEVEAPEFIALADMDEWDAFWRANTENGADGSELEALGYDTCLALAKNCELLIGGGAAPLFRIGFVD